MPSIRDGRKVSRVEWLLNRHAPKARRAREYMRTQKAIGYPSQPWVNPAREFPVDDDDIPF